MSDYDDQTTQYERPQLLKLRAAEARGECRTGSGDNVCNLSGSSAGSCLPGSGASSLCEGTGSTAGACGLSGSGPGACSFGASFQ